MKIMFNRKIYQNESLSNGRLEIVSYSIKIGVLETVVDLLVEHEQGNQKKAY